MKTNPIFLPFFSLLAVSATFAAEQAAGDGYIWWEGEDFAETTIANPVDMSVAGNKNAEQRAKLSGGRWLTVSDPADGGAATIRYEITVPADGSYEFWVRKFWKHGPFKWRFDDDAWRTLGKDISLQDSTYLEKHWGANWVFVDSVALTAGEHSLNIEMLENKGCFDCFLLTAEPFSPRGKLRPGEKTGLAGEGFFAWEPDKDPLTGESPLNLRFLNESVAGADGFLRREGGEFLLGGGEPVRFWMVQAGGLVDMDEKTLKRWAKRLAKYGVNLVRLQLSGLYGAYLHDNDQAFARQLDDLHRVIAALKEEGIYTYIGHLYWHTHNDFPGGIVPGFDANARAIALPFVASEWREFYQDYLEALLLPVNPYNGLALKDEPALGFIEINNESSLLFHTFNPQRFGAAELAYVEQDFGEWLTGKYGSIAEAQAVWGSSGGHTHDHPGEGRVGLYSAGMLGGADWAIRDRNPARAADQLEWMVETMRDYYRAVRTIIREDIGAGSLVSGSNWKTADERILGGLERYSYTETDVVLRNSYFSTKYPDKESRQAFFAVEENDVFASVTGLKAPGFPGPLATPQIADYPFMMTENNWTRPNRFRAEWPVLVAGYGSLQGLDGWNFFALDSSEWQTPMKVWDLNNPTILGQFPATALIYRRGDVRQAAQPAVRESINLGDAFNMKGTRSYAVKGEDAMWATMIGDLQKEGSESSDDIDPRAFMVGPVVHEFQPGPSSVEQVDLERFIDDERGLVRSMTGELTWDYRTGIVVIDTPRAQGVTGFLKDAGRIELGDVVIESQNEYGSILVVALDGKPLRESKSILVQTATEDQPYGFATKRQGDYQRIVDVGGYPLNVRKIDARVTVRSAADQAIVLDGTGYETERRADLERAGDRIRIDLPEDAIYTLLR